MQPAVRTMEHRCAYSVIQKRPAILLCYAFQKRSKSNAIDEMGASGSKFGSPWCEALPLLLTSRLA